MAEAFGSRREPSCDDDDDVAERAMSHLRTLRDGLSELGRTRTASSRVRAPVRVHELADALAGVADNPGDRSSRQNAADEALEVARRLATGEMPTDAEAIAAIVALRTASTDLMVFAGVDAEEADAAVREGTGEFRVAAPPSPPRAPFGLRRPTR